jgi:hypothetical protein
MSRTKQEKNKALVLEAFDTLFNKRDYVAAERYWSPEVLISHLGVRGCSISSRAFRRRSSMSPERSLLMETS